MPSKRDVLGHLTRDELLGVVDRFDLAVGDRRAKGGLVDAIGSSKAALAEVLVGLSRERLKELCRAFSIDDSGREKVALIDRLAGTDLATAQAVIEKPSGSRRANGASARVPAE